MKNIEAYNLYAKLTKGMEGCKVGFPVEINSARRKNLRILQPIVEDYEALKNDLIAKHGILNESGRYEVSLLNPAFMAEFNSLNNIENDIELVRFDESLIPDGLTPQEYDILIEMVAQ